jgi:capsular exopolysaccharide synthesis family protein
MLEAGPGGDSFTEPLHLRDYWLVLLRRRGLVLLIFVLVSSAGIAWVLTREPMYRASTQLLIERNPNILEAEKDPRSQEGWDDFFQTQCRLLQSRLLAEKVMERFNLLRDPEFLPKQGDSAVPGPDDRPADEQALGRFLERLRVEPVKGTQLVTVSFLSSQPQRAADVANALAEVYVRQAVEFRSRTTAEKGSRLEDETEAQARKVQEAEVALQHFNEDQGLVNIEERRPLLDQKLKDLGASLTAAKTRRLDKEALYQQMLRATDPEELSGAIASPLIQSLRTELATLDRQAAELLAKGYLEDYPDVVKVREQAENTRQKIAGEAQRLIRASENDYRVALAQEESVSRALEGAKGEALDLARRSLKYDALKRDLEASKKVSENILDRQKETDAARDVQVPNIHVVDAASVPLVPAQPRPVRDIALALLAGGVAGVLAAFFRDYMDTAIGKPGDVKRLGIPLLAVVPEGRKRKGALLVNQRQRREPFGEGYRVLRTALRPGEPGTSAQLLLITSTLPGEGKSLTSANLALTLAACEERVLLVETDLRRPTLSQILDVRPQPGLCEVVACSATVDQAVHRVPGTRLSVLAAGGLGHRNPADVLASGILRDLLSTARSSFDRIVLDAPPAAAVADALVLAPLADAVVIVARCGKVKTKDLVDTLDRLKRAGARIAGVVLNRARPDRHAYDYGPSFSPEAFAGRPARLAAAGGHKEGGAWRLQ